MKKDLNKENIQGEKNTPEAGLESETTTEVNEENTAEKPDSDIKVEELNLNNLNAMKKDIPKKEKKARKLKGVEIIKQKDEEIKNFSEQLLRKRAEFENFKRRTEQERADFTKYAAQKALTDLLPIIDSFDRALHPDHMNEGTEPIFKGFSLIYKQLIDYLGKFGVKEIITDDQSFDPHLHQAVSQEKKDDIESGKIIAVYQKGYMIHSKVLRPSMVVVAE